MQAAGQGHHAFLIFVGGQIILTSLAVGLVALVGHLLECLVEIFLGCLLLHATFVARKGVDEAHVEHFLTDGIWVRLELFFQEGHHALCHHHGHLLSCIKGLVLGGHTLAEGMFVALDEFCHIGGIHIQAFLQIGNEPFGAHHTGRIAQGVGGGLHLRGAAHHWFYTFLHFLLVLLLCSHRIERSTHQQGECH